MNTANISYPSSRDAKSEVIEKNLIHIKRKDIEFFKKTFNTSDLSKLSESELEDLMFFMIQVGAIQLVPENSRIQHVPHSGDFIVKRKESISFHSNYNRRVFGKYPPKSYFELKPKVFANLDLSRLQKRELDNSTHYIF